MSAFVTHVTSTRPPTHTHTHTNAITTTNIAAIPFPYLPFHHSSIVFRIVLLSAVMFLPAATPSLYSSSNRSKSVRPAPVGNSILVTKNFVSLARLPVFLR